MTELDKYNSLEDDLIRLRFVKKQLKWWQRLLGKPTAELKKSVEDIHRSAQIVSTHIESAKLEKPEKLTALLEKAEKEFLITLRNYPSLNRWNYCQSNPIGRGA